MSEYAKGMFIDDEAKESGKRQFSDGDFEDEMVSDQFSSISRTCVSYFDVITVFMYMHINAQIHHRVNNFQYLHKGRKLSNQSHFPDCRMILLMERRQHLTEREQSVQTIKL